MVEDITKLNLGKSRKRQAQARLDKVTFLVYQRQFTEALAEIRAIPVNDDVRSIKDDLDDCLFKCLMALGHYQEAVTVAQGLVSFDYNSPSIDYPNKHPFKINAHPEVYIYWYNLGAAKAKASDSISNQLRAFQKSVDLCPGFSAGYLTLFSLYSSLGCFNLARICEERHIATQPSRGAYPNSTAKATPLPPGEIDLSERSFPDDETISAFETKLTSTALEPLDAQLGDGDKDPSLL
jgi:tetratricopeptide (TPR) repeat protein